MDIAFRYAITDSDLIACFDVIKELRPALRDSDEWCTRVAAMRREGYRVLACWDGDRAVALAGYRLSENLVHGRFLFVNDLVTLAEMRGSGLGARLLDEMSEAARLEGCNRLVLDTGAKNDAAQRFYRRQGLQDVIVGFIKPIGDAQ